MRSTIKLSLNEHPINSAVQIGLSRNMYHFQTETVQIEIYVMFIVVFDFHQEADGMEESGRGQKK